MAERIYDPIENKKAVIAIDVDDVMWPLNEHVAEIAGIEYNRIVAFYAKDNPILSSDERDRLHNAYSTPDMHAHMDFYPGVELFGELARDPRVMPWIVSNSLDEQVIVNKDRNMGLVFGDDYSLFHKQMNIVSMETSKNKKFPTSIWLLFDDSPHNALKSDAAHILMPRKPYNTSEYAQRQLALILHKIYYYDGIEEGVDIARKLLDLDFGTLP